MLVLTSVEITVLKFAFVFAFFFATIMAKMALPLLPKKKLKFILVRIGLVVAFFMAGFGFVMTLAMLMGLFIR